jgi:Fe-S oxidoreductase
MWKEEEHGQERVNVARMREAMATGAGALAVACPFCMLMLTDAAGDRLAVRDPVEIIAEQLAPEGGPASAPQ